MWSPDGYSPAGGGQGGGKFGGPLEFKHRFSGHWDFSPGLTEGARVLTILFTSRIDSEPIDIAVA
jgi:hypothetical protein